MTSSSRIARYRSVGLSRFLRRQHVVAESPKGLDDLKGEVQAASFSRIASSISWRCASA
jgi:hypothetical protein